MAMIALSIFFVAGVLSVISTFLLLITWRQQKENGYKQAKVTGAAIIVTVCSFLFFLAVGEPAGSDLETADRPTFATAEEEAEWIIHTVAGERSSFYDEVIRELCIEDGTLETSLNASDNITTNLIQTGILTDSAKLFNELLKGDEIREVNMHWYFPIEEDAVEEDFEQVYHIIMDEETAASVNWEEFEVEDFEDIADYFWEHEIFRSE
ncbi:hypothetical protein [Bacillus sp. FJAT-44742]|uniref:hypothetical protein n=1 Tax=Bacillus sp. FJAT-44742 TaxID=2014005 RepID=UPI000C24FF50|nr:hypothetical protein [Bacillus sp. FJAT-44742]